MRKIDIFLFILINIILGSAFSVSGYVMQFLKLPIFTYALRFLIVGICFCSFYTFDKSEGKKMLMLGTFQALHFAGMALGVKYLSSSTTAIIVRLDIVFSVIFASIFLKEKIKFNTIFSILMCFLGIFIINRNIEIRNLWYLFLLIISAIFAGLVNIKIKSITKMDDMTITVYNFLITGVELMLLSFFVEDWHKLELPNIKGCIAILYLSFVATYLCYYLLYSLLRRNSISRTMPLQFFRIVVSIVFGKILLNEPITIVKILGTLMIVIGILVGQLDFKKRKNN